MLFMGKVSARFVFILKKIVERGLVEVIVHVSNFFICVDVMVVAGLSGSSSTGRWLPSIVGLLPQHWL